MSAFISNKELDELGDGIVRSYLRRQGIHRFPRCVDIEGLANSLGLHVKFADYAEEDTDKVGFLADGRQSIRIRYNGYVVDFVFARGTIVVDSTLRRDDMSGRCRFTIAHEVAHHILNRHNPVPQFQRIYDSSRDYTMKQLQAQFNMIETQADRLAASLLMPRFVVDLAMQDCNQGRPIITYGENRIFSHEERIKMSRMAEQMGVSFSALLYRLREYDLFENHPLDEYIEKNLLGEG